MKSCTFLFLVIALTSCNSFDRMKYRHLKKVPATPQEFPEVERAFTAAYDTIAPKEICAADSVMVFKVASVGNELIAAPVQLTGIPTDAALSPKEKLSSKTPVVVTPIKRDWSLLIGALLILCGLLMLALCIFYFPAAGISFLWVIAFELASLYAAWRMIGTGVMYFITRFRNKRNFSER